MHSPLPTTALHTASMNPRWLLFFILWFCFLACALAQYTTPIPKLVFMEPDAIRRPDGLTNYHIISDATRLGNLQKWLGNPSARWALISYSLAVASMRTSGKDEKPVYYIALEPGDARSANGFNIQGGTWVEPHPDQPYVVLREDANSFQSPFLTETGRLILKILRGGKSLPESKLKSCAHEPGVFPDRMSAFESGFVSHIQKIPDLSKNPEAGSKPLPTFHGTANQLLLSGEFHEVLFITALTRNDTYLLMDSVEQRLKRSMSVFAKILNVQKINADTPLLIDFIANIVQTYPHESPVLLGSFLDMSRGAFFKQFATQGSPEDTTKFGNDERALVHITVTKNPKVLYEMIGPQIRCEIPALKNNSNCFDINTAGVETLKLIPGITMAEIESFMKQRAKAAFTSAKDFRSRSGIGKKTMKQMKF